MKRLLLTICTITVLFSVLTVSASAASFIHIDAPSGKVKSVIAREMYKVDRLITADKLGLKDALEGLTDICVGKNGYIYVLCGNEGNSRTIVLDGNYSLLYELKVTDEKGQQVNYTGANGIFVDENGVVYIADTNNAQVLVINPTGRIIDRILAPNSDLIPKDFLYQPSRVIKDSRGYLYILSTGCYYGALSFAPDGEFLGFYGANTVNATALDTLAFLWDKLVGNDTKKAYSVKALPYSFVDFSIDSDNFLITCTGKTGLWSIENGTGQIKKITSDGANILYKNSPNGTTESASSFNFLEEDVILHNLEPKTQNFVSVDSDADGLIYGLDQTYGYIYIYDSECNLLNAFGGGVQVGERFGDFKKAVSIAVNNTDVLVADQANSAITVFKRTEYGRLFCKAQVMYINGDYADAEPYWKEVLEQDTGNQLAYRGIAMSCYGKGEYKKAMEYAESGLDYTVYDLAWQATLKGNSSKNFIWIVLVAVVIVGGLIWFAVFAKKKKLVLVRNEKLRTYSRVLFHPFETFSAVKYKKQTSWGISISLTFLLYISFVLKNTKTGFLYRNGTSGDYNSLFTLLQTVGLLLLWSVANWLVCSMFSGKGYFRDVFTATAYSFTPLILATFVNIGLSYLLPLSAEGIMTGLNTIAWIYSLFLLCIAIMTVHEYDFFKFLATCVGVFFFMIVAVFVIIFLFTVTTLVKDFISEIYEELVFR